MKSYDFKNFFDAAHGLLCIANLEGYFVEVNEEWTQKLGYTEEELLSRPFLDLVHPNDKERTIEETQKCRQNGHRVIQFENRYMDSNQNIHWLQWSAISDSQYIYASARDVTPFKNLTRYFNNMQEIANIGYWSIDLKNNRPVWSDKTYDIHEVERGTPVDMENAINYYHESVRDEVSQKVTQGIAHGTPWDEEWPFITHKGKNLWVRAMGKPLLEKGKVTSIHGIFQDITILRSAQEQLAQSAKLVTLGEMAANIAHEIKSPLAAINSHTTTLELLAAKGDIDCQMAKKIAASIEKTVSRIDAIINSLKKYSRDDSQIEKYECLVEDIVQDVILISEGRFKSKQTRLKFTNNTPGVKILCQSTQISQVLINCLNNSLQAIQSIDDKWVTIETQQKDGEIEISITDCGNGIPKEDHSKIFDPFYTTKPLGEGTGIGLSISQDIILGHGGHIKLDPTSSNTKFSIFLPT